MIQQRCKWHEKIHSTAAIGGVKMCRVSMGIIYVSILHSIRQATAVGICYRLSGSAVAKLDLVDVVVVVVVAARLRK